VSGPAVNDRVSSSKLSSPGATIVVVNGTPTVVNSISIVPETTWIVTLPQVMFTASPPSRVNVAISQALISTGSENNPSLSSSNVNP